MNVPAAPDRVYVWILRPLILLVLTVAGIEAVWQFAAHGWSAMYSLMLLGILGLAILAGGLRYVDTHIMKLPAIPDPVYVWILRPVMILVLTVGGIEEARQFEARGGSAKYPLMLLALLWLAILAEGVRYVRKRIRRPDENFG